MIFGAVFFDMGLFEFECTGIELIICAFLGNQLLMAAAFDNPSVVEYHDDIGIFDGR